MKPLSTVRFGLIGAGQIAYHAADALAESNVTGREVRLQAVPQSISFILAQA